MAMKNAVTSALDAYFEAAGEHCSLPGITAALSASSIFYNEIIMAKDKEIRILNDHIKDLRLHRDRLVAAKELAQPTE